MRPLCGSQYTALCPYVAAGGIEGNAVMPAKSKASKATEDTRIASLEVAICWS